MRICAGGSAVSRLNSDRATRALPASAASHSSHRRNSFSGGQSAPSAECSRRSHSFSAAARRRCGSSSITTARSTSPASVPSRGRTNGARNSQPGKDSSSPGASSRPANSRSLANNCGDRGCSSIGSSVQCCHLQHRSLRLGVEQPHRFDQVAEELDAHRARRFRREHVQDAAAHRVLAHHLDRVAALVADALQVRDDLFERDLLLGAQRQRELPIEVGRVGPQQRGGDRRDGYGHAPARQPPQPDGPLLADLRVRRQVLVRQHVQRGNHLRAAQTAAGGQQVEERLHRLGEQFGLPGSFA